MKTHELAAALNLLAKWLRSNPNTEVDSLSTIPREKKPVKEAPASATALSSLVAFSTFTKQQWAELITAYDIPVEIKSTYSSRDVMGKIMKYFADDNKARNTLLNKLKTHNEQVSPALMRALEVLLKS